LGLAPRNGFAFLQHAVFLYTKPAVDEVRVLPLNDTLVLTGVHPINIGGLEGLFQPSSTTSVDDAMCVCVMYTTWLLQAMLSCLWRLLKQRHPDLPKALMTESIQKTQAALVDRVSCWLQASGSEPNLKAEEFLTRYEAVKVYQKVWAICPAEPVEIRASFAECRYS
jgi:hypothetical protein